VITLVEGFKKLIPEKGSLLSKLDCVPLFKFLIIFLTLNVTKIKAQNCTVNAGTDILLCQTLSDTLRGNAAGIFSSNPVWRANNSNLVLSDSLSLKTSIGGFQRGQNYILTLRAVCGDGTVVSDQIVIKGGMIPNTPFAGNDTTVCAGQGFIQLSAAHPGNGLTSYWSTIGSKGKFNDSSKANTKFQPLLNSCDSISKVFLSWTVYNGECAASDQVQISFVGGGKIYAGKAKVVKCANKVTLSANCTGGKNHIGYWEILSGPSGAVFSDSTKPNAMLSNLQVGHYSLRWNQSGVCYTGYDTTSVEVISIVPPTPASAGSNQLYCIGSQPNTITLKGNTPAPNEVVLWQQISGPSKATISNDTAIQTTVTGISMRGSYRFQYSIIDGVCVSSAVSSVVIDSAAFSEGGPDIILPPNISAADFAPKSTGGTYSFISGPLNTQVSGNKTTGLFNIGAYTYLYTYKNKCGTFFDTVSVFASYNPTTANAGTDQVYKCGVNSGELAANMPTMGSGTWSQVSGPGVAFISNPQSPNTQISQLIEGTYKFKWTVSGGVNVATSSDDITIKVSSRFNGTSDAGMDRHVLPGRSIYMTASAPGSTENGYWRQIQGNSLNMNDSNDNNAVISGFQIGQTYKLVWTIYNGCGESKDTLSIFTDYNESSAITNGDHCLSGLDSIVVLRAQDPQPLVGHWEFIGGTEQPRIKYNGIDTLVLVIQKIGNYQYRWVVSDQNGNTDADTISIMKIDSVRYADAGKDIEICEKLFKLSGNQVPQAQYQWTSSRNFISAEKNASEMNVMVLDSGLFTFRYQIDMGICGTTWDEVNVIVREAPENPFAGNDTAIYSGSRLRLSASAPLKGVGRWTWLRSDYGNPIVINPSNPYSSINGLENGKTILSWTVSTANICPVKSDTVEIIRYPSAVNVQKHIGCEGGITELKSDDTLKSVGVWEQVYGSTISFSGSDGQTNVGGKVNASSILVSPAKPGIYVFKYTPASANNYLFNIDTLIIIENPVANAGADQTIKYTDSKIFFLAGNGGQKGRWMQVSGPGCVILAPTNKGSAVKYTVPGKYVFRYFATNGFCESFDEMNLEVLPKDTVDTTKSEFHAGVYVPNSFTPNDNGLNDKFKPVSADSLNYEMIIYNRWGEIISKSTEKDCGWDGKYRQEACPQENYFYIITYLASSKDGQYDGGTISGQILLLR